VRITYEIKNYTTNSGKQVISWRCENCHCCFFELGAYFYQSTLVKDDLEKSLESFVVAINNKTVNTLFKKPMTAKKLYYGLCNCTDGVVNIDYLRGVKRAKDILARGEIQCK
jgi:hypothetical protein